MPKGDGSGAPFDETGSNLPAEERRRWAAWIQKRILRPDGGLEQMLLRVAGRRSRAPCDGNRAAAPLPPDEQAKEEG